MVPPDSANLTSSSVRPIVSNTTPLINLAGVGLLHLLQQLYGAILIPEAVSREYAAGVRPNEPSLEDVPWITVARSVTLQSGLPSGLGAGEVEAISLAITENAGVILLDERVARNIAREQGLPVVGTLAVLVAAKQRGYLLAVKPVIDSMIAQGRRISDSLYRQVLAAANELL